MISRSFFSVGMAIWVLFQVAAAAVTHGAAVDTLVNRQFGPGTPDQNSTSLSGVIQHVKEGERLVNVTVVFSVPTLHIRYNNMTPQGTNVFAAVDLEGCNSTFKFGVNSVIYSEDGNQSHEFFYHWTPGLPMNRGFENVTVNAGDDIAVTLEPNTEGNTLAVSITNNSGKQSTSFVLGGPQGDGLCLSNFAVMIEDPTSFEGEDDTPDTTAKAQAFAEFGAVNWAFVGGWTDSKPRTEYDLQGTKWVYMTNDKTAKYRVASFRTGPDTHRMVMAGQDDSA